MECRPGSAITTCCPPVAGIVVVVAEGVKADYLPVPHAATPIATATATIVLHMMTPPI